MLRVERAKAGNWFGVTGVDLLRQAAILAMHDLQRSASPNFTG
jgi:hypothetical protein